MIREPIETVKARLKDSLRRREQGLPAVDDDGELLERALRAIEELEDWRNGQSAYG